MHIKICTLLCHFNWLKSLNRQQKCPDLPQPPSTTTTSRSWPRLKALAIFCHAKHIFRLARYFLPFISSNLCLQLRAVEHISLACNVTVALWRSVEWRCCFGKIAGGCCPTYPIITDVHHTSQSATFKETHISGIRNRGERRKVGEKGRSAFWSKQDCW